MEADILDGSIGKLGKYDLEFKGGKLCVEVDYSGGIVDAGVVLKLDAKLVFEALKKLIPGQIDDAIFDGAYALISK